MRDFNAIPGPGRKTPDSSEEAVARAVWGDIHRQVLQPLWKMCRIGFTASLWLGFTVGTAKMFEALWPTDAATGVTGEGAAMVGGFLALGILFVAYIRHEKSK